MPRRLSRVFGAVLALLLAVQVRTAGARDPAAPAPRHALLTRDSAPSSLPAAGDGQPATSPLPAAGDGQPATGAGSVEAASGTSAGTTAGPSASGPARRDRGRELESNDDDVETTYRPVADIFDMRAGDRLDAYGPRPPGLPTLTREQIMRYALENPLVQAASEHVEAMRAQLAQARFAWAPIVRASALLSPGVNIHCSDVSVQQANGGGDFTLQWCRSPTDDGSGANDLQTIGGYLAQLKDAGVNLRLSAEFVAPLFTFGKLKAVRELAQVAVAVAGLAMEQARQETLLQVTEAHVGLLLTRESIRILDEAWDVVTKERRKIEQDLGADDDFDADPDDTNLDRDPDDLLQLEVGEIELATRMREARKLESLALATLWALAGRAAPPGFDIAERRLRPNAVTGGLKPVAHYRDLAVRERPEAKMAEGLVHARKAQERLARANFFPDLGLVGHVGVGYGKGPDEVNGRLPTIYSAPRLNYNTLGLALAATWNLDFHNDTFGLRKARAEHRRAIHQREAAHMMLAMAVEQAYRDLIEARDNVEFMALARDKSWQLVVSQQQKATVGGGDFGDLRRALTGWAEYEFKHFEAIQSQNVAIARLARAVGVALTKR